MKKFIKKYLPVSKTNLTEPSDSVIGGESIVIKSGHRSKISPVKADNAGKTHCKFIMQGNSRLLLTDLSDKSATYLNGKKMRTQTPVPIAAGDEVEFRNCGVKISFELDKNSQTQEKVALLGSQSSAREPDIDAGIVLSDLVNDPSFHSSTATYDEIEKADISTTIERLLTQTEINTREKVINIVAGIRRAIHDVFSHSLICSYYTRVVFLVLGLVLGGSYFLTRLDFAAENPEIKVSHVSDLPVFLEKEDIKQYAAFDNLLPVAELKSENDQPVKENQLIIDKVLTPSTPKTKRLVSNSQLVDTKKQTLKKRSTVKNRKRNRHKAPSESSDPHIDAWAKEFFTN